MNKKQILIILIPTFIFMILWIVFSIYHANVTSTVSDAVNMQILQISPNFDTKTIEKLKQRQLVNPINEISGSSQVLSPVNEIPPKTIASPSSEVASAGGSLQ